MLAMILGPSESSLTSIDSVLPSGVHPLIVVSQVVLKNTVTVRQTLRLCGQRVNVEYGGWQTFLPTRNCTSRMMFQSQIACHKGYNPLSNLLPSLPLNLPC